MAMKIKKGDRVLVVSGKDKGASGKVIEAYPDSQRVLVEGVNRIKKHTKIGQTTRGAKTGGIVTQEAPIHVSNVMLLVEVEGKKVGSRIGYRVETVDREELYQRSRAAQKKLHDLLMGKEGAFLNDSEWENFLNKLGLTSRSVAQLFGKAAKVRFLRGNKIDDSYVPGIEVHTVRPAFRAGREDRQVEQVVVTLTQQVAADVGSDGVRKRMIFRGGCSLILGLGSLNKVEYVVAKNIRSFRRFCAQRDYINGEGDNAAPQSSSLYSNDDREWQLNFNLLHRHLE